MKKIYTCVFLPYLHVQIYPGTFWMAVYRAGFALIRRNLIFYGGGCYRNCTDLEAIHRVIIATGGTICIPFMPQCNIKGGCRVVSFRQKR